MRPSPTREPDVVIGTDASTWLALREGRISGLDAFSQRRLYARGDLDLAVGFEGLFHLPGGRDPLLRITDVETRQGRVTSLIAGHGAEHVICLHGLGSNKASFFETVAALSPDYTVHAIDLPGFGSSAKPARAPYNALWFAARGAAATWTRWGSSAPTWSATRWAAGSRSRSASATPTGSRASACWRRRSPSGAAASWCRWCACCDPSWRRSPTRCAPPPCAPSSGACSPVPSASTPPLADIAIDEFCRTYRSRAARVAFFAAARNIYLDEPHGEAGFYARLAELEPPALFVWGDDDRLIPAGFSRHVAEALPEARQVILDDCGHVPQVELAEQTNRLIRTQIASAAGRLAGAAPLARRAV